jgi:arsenate reductase (thioredoxin)
MPIRVLFLCTANSARSQIAEALLAREGGAAFAVVSAGTHASSVNPFTVRTLAAVGIDWSRARSKLADGFLGESFDYVITVCDAANEACPYFPGALHRLHWSLEDPAKADGTDAEKLAAFERTRREIADRVPPFIRAALEARNVSVG